MVGLSFELNIAVPIPIEGAALTGVALIMFRG